MADKRKIGVVELVTKVGDDNLFFQSLDQVAINYRLKRGKKGEQDLTAIEFLTDAITPTQVMRGNTERMALVVWLPRQRVAEILADGRERT